jgi:hypothetical protein
VATTNKYLKGDLPIVLSTSIPTALVRYQREDFAASYAIGNTPWLSAASDNNRISRITTTYQKERIDQSSTTGEQSLTNWWLRSATTWQLGAGERYYDADTSDQFRFYESNNINPWNIGEIKLLPATVNANATAATQPTTVLGGTFFIQSDVLKFYNESTAAITSITLTGGATPYKLTTDGAYCIVAASDGIYDVTTAGDVRKLWNHPTYVAATWVPQAIAYVKERIVVAALEGTVEVGVYEISRTYTTPTPRISAAEERFETTNTSTVVNSIAELPGAVIVGYTQGSISRVQMYTINPSSPTAAIVGPTIIAELPRGETLNQIRVYLNEYVVLGTSKGLRVGTVGTDNQSFTYGPLTIDGDVKDIALDQEFIYATRSVAYSGTYGLWRLNLGSVVENGYAYASDLSTDSGTVNGVSFIGTSGRKFITSSSGVWTEHATNLAASGYLKSGWIRWGTTEKKQPVNLNISTLPNSGGVISMELVDQTIQNVNIGSLPIGQSVEIGLSGSVQPADHFEITFSFTRDTADATKGPTLESWQIRALPAPLRSRTITVPLLCYEEERDSNGVTKITSPWERVSYLERIEQNGGAVLYQDFSSGEERVCVIRAIQFEQTAPPTYASGFGGIVTVQLQTIDTEQAIQ